MHLVDMHCDTLLECYKNNCGIRANDCHVDLESMKKSNVIVQFFAAFLPEGQDALEEGISIKPDQLFGELESIYSKEILSNNDMISKATTYEDVVHNLEEGKMSGILSVEDGNLLDGDIRNLDVLYEKGVRLMTLLWNCENCIGYPSSANTIDNARGLKPFGIEAVKRMNELGIIVDVSHMSEGCFYDVAKHSKKPFVASHSCSKNLCNHPRNLTDDQLKCIANTGGVVGVNYYSKFLKEGSNYSTVDDIIRHIDHMINVMGSDSIALGSDFDGVDCDLEVNGYKQMYKLVDALEKKYSAEIVEKICHKNALRILKECLKK